jgi:hypothetical protein
MALFSFAFDFTVAFGVGEVRVKNAHGHFWRVLLPLLSSNTFIA